jgi:hypothetical protein
MLTTKKKKQYYSANLLFEPKVYNIEPIIYPMLVIELQQYPKLFFLKKKSIKINVFSILNNKTNLLLESVVKSIHVESILPTIQSQLNVLDEF